MSLASDQINRMLLLRIFSEATKIIKCWAKRRAIYSFNFGYLNGISIMIMVAKTIHVMHLERSLMLDDAKTLIQLVVERFFSLFEAWPWTSSDVKQRAVYLSDISDPEDYPWASLSNCVMPILCPYPPYKCTTLQMTSSSLAKIFQELRHGWQVIIQNKVRTKCVQFAQSQ